MGAFQAVNALPVYIGYDPREDDAYRVCLASLSRHSSIPLHIIKLEQPSLRRSGLYNRPYERIGNQRVDLRDGKPFSTEFSFTRFLLPALSLYQGWALFCDSDFLFRDDIAEVFAKADERYAVMVVKHRHEPKVSLKMDGQRQEPYPRKNWSSFVLWNCGHPAHRALTPQSINWNPGSWLHGFSWLRDEEIGELPLAWNWLSGVSDSRVMPSAVHFTNGIPSMPGYETSPYADLWFAEQAIAGRMAPFSTGAGLPTAVLTEGH